MRTAACLYAGWREIGSTAGKVSWLVSAEAGGGELLVRRVSRGGALGEPVRVASLDASRSGGFPQMLATGDRLLFAWTTASGVRTATVSASAVPPPPRPKF